MAAIISIAAMEKLRRCISFVAAHPTSFRFFVLVRLLRTSGAGLQAFGYPWLMERPALAELRLLQQKTGCHELRF